MAIYAGAHAVRMLNRYFRALLVLQLHNSFIGTSRYGPERRYLYKLNSSIWKIIGVAALKYTLPIYKSFGLWADARFMFGPIPVDFVSLEKIKMNGKSQTTLSDEHTEAVFTRCNPGYITKCGILYQE